MILPITDQLTKWEQVLRGCKEWSAKDWSKEYYKYIYEEVGLPEKIISDRGGRFLFAFWQGICSLANIKLAIIIACNAKADGQLKRTNQTTVHALRCAIAAKFDQSNWDDLLPALIFALNTSINASTGSSPYELRYARQPPSPPFDSRSAWPRPSLSCRAIQ
jgi:hypothetical protein